MSLVELADYKMTLGISGSSEDTKLSQYSLEIDEKVKNYLGRDIEETSYTELYDGSGNNRLVVEQYPIVSITSLEVYQGLNADDTENWDTWVQGEDYDRLMNEDNSVFLGGTTFPKGDMNIRLTYIAGYSSIPDDIQNVCKKLMILIYKKIDEGLMGVNSKSNTVGASMSDTYDLEESKVLKEIEYYRRMRL